MFFNKIFDLLVSIFCKIIWRNTCTCGIAEIFQNPIIQIVQRSFFPQKYMYMYLQGPFISMFMVPIMNMYLSSILVEYNNTILLTSLGDT